MKSNPVYGAYAKAHGKTPKEMAKYDRNAMQCGNVCGYMQWVFETRDDFKTVCLDAFINDILIDYGAWLRFLQG